MQQVSRIRQQVSEARQGLERATHEAMDALRQTAKVT